MIICHCHHVTDRDIEQLIKDGARSLEDIKCKCCACTKCAGCEPAVKEILENALKIQDREDAS